MQQHRPKTASTRPTRVAVLLTVACAILLTGCASLRVGNVTELDQIASGLEQDPNPQVDLTEVEKAAVNFEEEDRSLSAVTPERFTQRVKVFFLALVNLDPDEQASLIAFGEGVELFDQGRFEEAAKVLWKAYFRWPDSPLQEDAIFLRAESFFFANQYGKAVKEYDRLLQKYSSTRYLDRVSPRLFAIAQYWDKLDQVHNYSSLPNLRDKKRPTFSTYREAVRVYKLVASYDPNGMWADHALMAAGNASYIRGEYTSAAACYDDLIKRYPQSRHLLPACELNLSAKLLMYQGPEYDGKALEDADQLAERLLSQFGTQLGPRRDEVVHTRNRITEAKAERDIAFAQFYETKRLYRAARMYYWLVMQDFPQTEAAEYARQRYNQILEYPAEPPDYFSWLNRIFPEK